MVVANKTIIKKMMSELQEALANESNPSKVSDHISNVRLLCDVMLEDKSDEQGNTSETITDSEMKAMIGDTKPQPTSFRHSVIDDDEDANGDSIFDF
ncbi:YwdI family protein [Oceanobacillus halotolerans]|uniref:YwdI family protein n=1 Tax=Oceanobacillus halotolerans TaxID=2663380 RepID=UPI0013D9FE01|nr:YwdI family protein [Oceanobacillus halotolerans]